MKIRIASVATLIWATSFFGLAQAQNYPVKPVRIIVPYAAGGAVDVTARAIAPQAAELLGQPVVVENRPGGSAIIGMQACAKAEPDGHTLCMTTAAALSLNPHVFRNLPYDPDGDFAPVIYLVRGYSLLLAKQNAPFNTFKEMIAYAKSHPGALNWATWGAASIPEVYLLWIGRQAGIDITGVAYKGSGPSVVALLAGESDITYQLVGAVLPHIRAGKLKPLAVVGNQRSSHLPDTPSLVEEGHDPGMRSYFGLFAPAKTPGPVIDRLNAVFAKAMQSARFQEFARAQTLDVVGGSAAEFAEFLKKDRANAGRVFKVIGVRPVDAP